MGVTRVAKRAAEAAGRSVSTSLPSTSSEATPSCVVYLGHIPHGFYEDQMRDYFSQFGTVNKVRLSRNKKTGKSKHYAFLEFGNADVAKIAAEAMDGYHFFSQKLVARVMPTSEVHPLLFKGANRVIKPDKYKKLEIARHNAEKTPEQAEKAAAAAAAKDSKRKKRIAEAGIDYEYEGVSTRAAKRSRRTQFEE
ncbi:hypothetical protein H632_c274p2 [Helicosporidium sp. ATCC 50920]|nr:hypothetical protein H632_c274p2 [Helicosporidium sp. ATCC 50920]|eukprot:KDD76310.1 hypothetical protein H632_c274p2 [Helicosporidium sp. ATCC 50920]